MSILADKETKVVFQGITGSEGSFHARACMDYGTNVVAGVTPGKGRQLFEYSVPVYNRVVDAKELGALSIKLTREHFRSGKLCFTRLSHAISNDESPSKLLSRTSQSRESMGNKDSLLCRACTRNLQEPGARGNRFHTT